MKCAYVKQDGTHCGANALKTCSFCFSHSPKSVEAKRLAVVKGGENSHLNTQVLDKFPMQTSQDLVDILADTVHQLRVVGPMTTAKAKSIASLVRVAKEIRSDGPTQEDITQRMKGFFAERRRQILEGDD